MQPLQHTNNILTSTHADLIDNPEFNANASAEASINRTFGLEDITYKTEFVLERIFDHLTETNFLGITVRNVVVP